jgi:hypothetical protein
MAFSFVVIVVPCENVITFVMFKEGSDIVA